MPSPSPREALTDAPGGARLAVRLAPRARRDRIEGLVRDSDGRIALKVAVSAPPVDGKANAALIELVAEALGVARSAVDLASGAGSRRKLLFVAGDAAAMRARLARAVGAP